MQQRRNKRAHLFKKWLAGGVAALLMGSAAAASGVGIVPAEAAQHAALQLVKKVDREDAHRNLSPGQSVTFRIEFSSENYDVDGLAPDGKVTLTDVMPESFAGWEISGINANLPGNQNALEIHLPNVSPASEGTLGTSDAERTLTLDITAPTDDGLTGLPTGQQGWLEYTVTVPENLSPNWESNGVDLVNTASITGLGGATNDQISVEDTAVISVDVPRTVDVIPDKTWDPASQGFEPGAVSLITIGATQASNVAAESLVLQDQPSSVDGATGLDETNPFRYVDFGGFATDPADSASWPTGATDALVEVYAFANGMWNWTKYEGTIANADIAGVRLSYAGEIVPGASVNQAFTVKQRETDRLGDNTDLSQGYAADNQVEATVTVTGEPPVSKTDEANFAVTPLTIAVEAGKAFLAAEGEPVEPLRTVAGNRVDALLTAQNQTSPLSATLDTLTIKEPGGGADAEYFSNDLTFAGFDAGYTTQAWPAGATGGTITWHHAEGAETVALVVGGALPAVPAPLTNGDITGFEITFTGAIAPGATSQVKYAIDTNENLAPAGVEAGPFKNVIDVEGTRPGQDKVTDSDEANLIVVSPAIDVTVKKKLSPSIVLPGDDVIVQLPTTATASGDKTKPTEIIVTDELTDAGPFWDAFDATAVLAPIDVPTGSTLLIELFDSVEKKWVALERLTETSMIDIAVPLPESTTGISFTYTNDTGFGQSTTVKPNVKFEARDTLRGSGETTTPDKTPPFDPTEYKNVVTVKAKGALEGREVDDDATDTAEGAIRNPEWMGGTGVGGGLWAAKDWSDGHLVTLSGAKSTTKQSWAVTQTGFDSVTLNDPSTPSATGVGTVFDAFNLTRVQPITVTQDPQLQWDTVTEVKLWNGTDWVDPARVPATGWMNANGFVGYSLTAAEQTSTLGVRLMLVPNKDARTAAIQAGDIGAPGPEAGVSASAAERSYKLDWQLRDKARTGDWVTSNAGFNCFAEVPAVDLGCVDNTFGLVGAIGDARHTATANDRILLLDGTPNVSLTKTIGGLADGKDLTLIVPKHGDVAQKDYPTTWYTLTATNSSGTGDLSPTSKGVMKLGKIRVTDEATADIGNTPMNTSSFSGRVFSAEVGSDYSAHFDVLNVTGLSFTGLPGYIDRAQSTVELWLYNDDASTTAEFSIEQIEGEKSGGPTEAQLADTIGVSVTYQGTDPETHGNRILSGDKLSMQIDVQLRAEHRVSGDPLTGGANGTAIAVRNQALALGQDLVVDDALKPTDTDTAKVNLKDAQLDVALAKTITIEGRGKKLLEASPQTPVDVVMTATPGQSKTPLSRLTVEDKSEAFWSDFELVALPAPATKPLDSDQFVYDYWIDDAWVAQADSDLEGNALTDVKGVRITFDRADGQLFPLGATSWTSNWSSAQLPLKVKLRAENSVDWHASEFVENTASTTAYGTNGDQATDTADASIGFDAGTRQVTVQKRAPLDTTTHQVEPLVSMPWALIVTNDGTGYLPLESIVDELPETLNWDGVAPTFAQTGGTNASIDPTEIDVELSADERQLTFTWPAGTRMAPGETITINLGIMLQPGLQTAEQAWNAVIVETGVSLDRCTQPKKFGQDPSKVSESGDTQCANANFVTPLTGTLIGAQKFVNGEFTDTLGEDLVSGAMNTKKPEATECVTPGAPANYTRTECADFTAVGATDNWLLKQVNAGTNSLGHMLIVDMLPTPGDLLLVGGPAPRNSTFQPVIDLDSFEFTDLPEGAVATISVTTDATACVGDGTGPSKWTSADPFCEDTTLNPGNGSWVALTEFDGLEQDVAGFRVHVDMTANALLPGKWVNLKYNTVNRVVEQAERGLAPALSQFQTPQFAWNQSGVFAWDMMNRPISLVKAPQPAGVTLKTGALEVSKTIEANGVIQIPEAFEVALECTVPSGIAEPERVALDMGEQATLTLPADGTSVRVDGLPIGTDCEISEVGELGSNGEIARSFQVSDGVNPAVDGQTAEIKIREPRATDVATVVGLTNTYALGDLVIEKSVRSDNEFDLDQKTLAKSFDFELSCETNGATEPITRNFSLKSGEQFAVSDLPQGAVCELTELTDGGANSVHMTVNNATVEAKQLGGIAISDISQHVLVSNGFLGEQPDDHGVESGVEGASDASGTGSPDGTGDGLEVTGGEIAGLVAAAIVLLALGAGAIALSRRRRA